MKKTTALLLLLVVTLTLFTACNKKTDDEQPVAPESTVPSEEKQETSEDTNTEEPTEDSDDSVEPEATEQPAQGEKISIIAPSHIINFDDTVTLVTETNKEYYGDLPELDPDAETEVYHIPLGSVIELTCITGEVTPAHLEGNLNDTVLNLDGVEIIDVGEGETVKFSAEKTKVNKDTYMLAIWGSGGVNYFYNIRITE